MWLLRILCSYLSQRCVFVYALFISSNTSSLVSYSCHRFYSLSWHFSQGFISCFLFQLLKFLSPASWGFGCTEKVMRILTDWGRKPDVPRAPFPPHFCNDSGNLRVLPFPRGLPHVRTWGASRPWEWTWGFLLRQLEKPKARREVGIWGFVTPLKHQAQIQMLTNFLSEPWSPLEIILNLLIGKWVQETRE